MTRTKYLKNLCVKDDIETGRKGCKKAGRKNRKKLFRALRKHLNKLLNKQDNHNG